MTLADADDSSTHARQVARRLLVLATAWIAGATALLFFDQWLAETLWIIALFLDVAWLAFGVPLFLTCAVVAGRPTPGRAGR